MKVNVNIKSQGRLLDGLLFYKEDSDDSVPALLFEGSITGATAAVTQRLAEDIAAEGFVCLIIDHNYFSEDEMAPQPWESPIKRIEDIKAGLQFLEKQQFVDSKKIIGVGVSVGAEFIAKACQQSGSCQGLIMVEGSFDDSQNLVGNLDIPTIIFDENDLEMTAERIIVWARSLFAGREDTKPARTGIYTPLG